MRLVPREAFVAPGLVAFSHDDGPLPIERGQTIPLPYIVTLMIEAADLQFDACVWFDALTALLPLDTGRRRPAGPAPIASMCSDPGGAPAQPGARR